MLSAGFRTGLLEGFFYVFTVEVGIPVCDFCDGEIVDYQHLFDSLNVDGFDVLHWY